MSKPKTWEEEMSVSINIPSFSLGEDEYYMLFRLCEMDNLPPRTMLKRLIETEYQRRNVSEVHHGREDSNN